MQTSIAQVALRSPRIFVSKASSGSFCWAATLTDCSLFRSCITARRLQCVIHCHSSSRCYYNTQRACNGRSKIPDKPPEFVRNQEWLVHHSGKSRQIAVCQAYLGNPRRKRVEATPSPYSQILALCMQDCPPLNCRMPCRIAACTALSAKLTRSTRVRVAALCIIETTPVCAT